MIKRLIYGLIFGLFVGAVVAAATVRGLGVLAFSEGAGGSAMAYLMAAVTGVLVGLVAGKPIWAAGAKIEAGLKAGFGALLAAGLMFVARRWANVDLDLSSFGAGPVGPTHMGALPAATLPAIAALLGAFYEADNTPEKESGAGDEKPSAGKGKVRVGAGSVASDDEALVEPAARKARR
jgi:hypothetical protein